MASVRLYYDKRTMRVDGTSAIRVLCSYKGIHTYFHTDIAVVPEQYDPKGGKNGRSWVKAHPRMDAYNSILFERMNSIEDALLSLSRQLNITSEKELKNAIISILESKEQQENKIAMFCDVMDKFLTSRRGRTIDIYKATIVQIERFTNYHRLQLQDITPVWLTSFHAYLADKGNSINSIAIHERNIRAVYNYAIMENEQYASSYPFRRYKIKTENTPVRTLTAEQLVTLLQYPCEPHQEIYRDMFMLSFYLIGINPSDLFTLTRKNVVGDRIEYRRKKTGKLYSIKVPVEAWNIINRYRGKYNLLCVCDKWNERNFLRACNIQLKCIGEVQRVGLGGKKVRTPLFPSLSMYWARYSWANIAHRLGIPKDTISMALGHSFGVRITDVYIDYDSEIVDKANRQVIDYINSLVE